MTRVGAQGHVLDDEAYAVAREAGVFRGDVVEAAGDMIRMGRIKEMPVG